MASIGSVFLGDTKRIRVLSSSTPPSSPPPTSAVSMSGVLSGLPNSQSPDSSPTSEEAPPSQPSSQPFPQSGTGVEKLMITREPPPTIDPITSLELRLRLLETLVVGVDPDQKSKHELKGDTVARSASHLQRQLDIHVEGNDTLKRFIDHYDQYEQYLTPAFALGLLEEPTYDSMSMSDLAIYLHDMESEVRTADSDMQEIEVLIKKGVTDAGKLASYVELEPRLDALLKAEEENQNRADALERRIARMMETHATYIDTLSELFVAWDDTITDAEKHIARFGRDLEERRRLGLE